MLDQTPEIAKLKALKKQKMEMQREISVTKNSVRGYLVKTVQNKGMLKKNKFLTRYYVLNAQASTLYIADDPADTSGMTIEFRTNRLVHVETNLRKDDELIAAQFSSNSS